MTDQNSNPFVLPGMGQGSADAAGNPLLASMEMMRQAWAGLTGPGGLAQVMPMTPPMNLQDLERRIAELRAVESWLRMNLSMLSSTIQGMEVQRSTIATLRSFVDNLSAQGQDPASWGAASPLEVALGLKPAPGRSAAAAAAPARDANAHPDARPETGKRSWAGADAGEPRADAGADDAGADTGVPGARNNAAPSGGRSAQAGQPSGAEGQAGAGAASAGSAQAISQAAQSASEAWWGMLQQQFNQLAAATAASMPGGAPGGAATQQGGTQEGGTQQGAKQQGGSTTGTPGAGVGGAGAAATGGGAGQASHAASAGRRAAAQTGGSEPPGGKKAAAPAGRAAPRKTAVRKNKIQSDSDQS